MLNIINILSSQLVLVCLHQSGGFTWSQFFFQLLLLDVSVFSSFSITPVRLISMVSDPLEDQLVLFLKNIIELSFLSHLFIFFKKIAAINRRYSSTNPTIRMARPLQKYWESTLCDIWQSFECSISIFAYK